MEQKPNNSPVEPAKTGLSTGAKIAIIATVIFFVLAISGGAFWWVKFGSKQISQIPSQPTANQQSQSPMGEPNVQNQSSAVTVPKNNNDGTVEWYPSPKIIGTPKIYTESTDFGAKTWEVGKIISGANSGNKIILMAFQPEGPGGFTLARFMLDKEGKLNIFDEYSNALTVENNDSIDTNVINNYPVFGVAINSLEYPGVLYTPKGEKMLKVDDFPVGGLSDEHENIFFSNDLLKKAFTDPVYGEFFTTDQAKINEDNSYSVYGKYGFYVKAPDGTFKVYSLEENILGPNDVADVVWNDGQKNTSKFTNVGPTGCGASKYTDVVDAEVKLADLVASGKNAAGETIYEYKDRNEKYLKDFYDEDVNYLKNYPELVSEKKFTKGMTYDQFVNAHVVFFHQDSFGRLVRFINMDFKADPGGCGKPVIYLYPEKTENVSVKVSPTGGMTKSEPDYGVGWNVIADSMSRIKNFADGKTYPYLFWEGKSNEIYDISRFGFVASREELENLLDDKLAKLGLISKEIADFKEFWLPKMLVEEKPYYFVTFVPQSKIDKMAPLEISPRPDTTIRVMMDYKGLDEKIEATGYEIKTPERKGFTAVEWGGMLK